MSFEHEKREALHLLHGIENGTLRTVDAAHLIGQSDPALVYFLITWLRGRYGADHAAAEGVLGRLVELTNDHPAVTAAMREGKSDAVVAWFEEAHNYREFNDTEFVDLIVEKLEG